MALHLIALPIGNPDDISLRALKCLKEAEILIGEEPKIARRWLVTYGLKEKIENLYVINEHSNIEDIKELAKFCKTKTVALFSDCGTASFCDPGYKLVHECRKQNIEVHSLPGASSLMHLLSLSSRKTESFHFIGFLNRDKTIKKDQWTQISKNKEACIIMDTPYRFQQTMKDLKEHIPNRDILVGGNLTSPDEFVYDGKATSFGIKNYPEKAEFLILIYPS